MALCHSGMLSELIRGGRCRSMSTLAIKSRLNFCIAVMGVLAALLLLHSSVVYGQNKGSQQFGGAWWSTVSHDERLGFLYALDDCLTYDRKPGLWFDDTWINYEKKVSAYYASSSADQTVSVNKVFEHFGKAPAAHGGIRQSERYGDEFWRAHSDTVRRGFLEGYFSCRSGSASKWPKTLDFYLEHLNDLYNVDDRKGENAPEYTGSVASALEKLGDLR